MGNGSVNEEFENFVRNLKKKIVNIYIMLFILCSVYMLMYVWILKSLDFCFNEVNLCD